MSEERHVAPSMAMAVACGAMLNLGYMSLWLQPAVIGEITGVRHIPVDLAGVIATGETLTVSGVLLLAFRWKGRIAYRAVGLAGLMITALATLACFVADGFVSLLVARLVAAIGFGLMLVVPNLALASFERTDLMFGRLYTLNLLWSALLVYAMPWVERLGFGPAPFVGYLLSCALMLPLFLLMPAAAASRSMRKEDVAAFGAKARKIVSRLAFGSAAVGLGFGLVWAFFVLLGQKAGMAKGDAITASSLSLLGAFLGSALASQSRFFAITLPIFRVALFAAAASLLCIALSSPPPVFVAAGMIAMFGMYFFFPTVLGAAGKIDDTGRSVALINGSLSTLSAIGPLIGGVILAQGGRYLLGFLAAGAVCVAIIAFETVLRRGNERNASAAKLGAGNVPEASR